MREVNKTLLIICEGEKTEPLFFNSIRDELINDNFDNAIRKIKLVIAPEPIIDEDEIIIESIHKRKRKQRTTKQVDFHETINILPGKPPLRWVETGKQELRTGAYDEVWCVFDNDNHPAKKEAFESAKELIDGKTVNIAYSSRSFEYYLLIHFERIYKTFAKTDCKHKVNDKKIFTRCGSNLFPEFDCQGKVCINGYAKSNEYWENNNKMNTKNSSSVYSLIKDNFQKGFENSEWIRFKSNSIENDKPIYERNPYLTIDKLVKVLINDTNHYHWIINNSFLEFGKIGIIINKNNISIKNISNGTIILPKNLITLEITGKKILIGDKSLVRVNEIKEYEIPKTFYVGRIEFEKHIVMFENEA